MEDKFIIICDLTESCQFVLMLGSQLLNKFALFF